MRDFGEILAENRKKKGPCYFSIDKPVLPQLFNAASVAGKADHS